MAIVLCEVTAGNIIVLQHDNEKGCIYAMNQQGSIMHLIAKEQVMELTDENIAASFNEAWAKLRENDRIVKP